MPSFMTWSIASGVPMPSCKAKIASLIIGHRIRLEMKPGASLASTGSLPITLQTSIVVCVVSSEVPKPRMTSTSLISGTGFMKCIPMTLSGRLVAAAIFVMLMDEVLLARMTSARALSSSSLKILNFNAGFSVAASITRSASPTTAKSETNLIPSAAAF